LRFKLLLVFLFILCHICFAKSFQIKPIAFTKYESAGGEWSVEMEPIYVAGIGFNTMYINKHLTIEAEFTNNRFFGLNAKPNEFSNEQGLSWEGHDPQGNKFDYDNADIKVSYLRSDFEAYIGKFDTHWGNGNSSLTISNKPPSYPKFGFNWSINKHLTFEYFHGKLKSLQEDTVYACYYDQVGKKSPDLNRFIVAHRLDWKLNQQITFGVTEIVVYGVRNLEVTYLMPFIPFWSLQHYLGDLDNVQMSANFIFQPSQNVDIFGVFMMDEWRPLLTFQKTNRNWFAYQSGFCWNNIFGNEDVFKLEYTWTDHRVYRHRFSINDYYSHGFPIGFWAGPHAEELLLEYSCKFRNLECIIGYSKAKRGELTKQMLADQYATIGYNRYSNKVEEKQIIGFNTVYKFKQLHFEFGVKHLIWNNAESKQFTTVNEISDIEKISFSFTIFYNN